MANNDLCNFSIDDCIYCSSYNSCLLKTLYYKINDIKQLHKEEQTSNNTEVLSELKNFIPLFENQDMHIIESGTDMSIIKEKLDAQAQDIKAIKEYLSIPMVKPKKKIWG